MIFSSLITILGLSLFEAISSVDNAVINAEVLSTMGQKARKWFLLWGMLLAVFVVRGLLPWLIVWAFNPSLGPLQAFTATWSGDPLVHASIIKSAPILLIAGGMFLVFFILSVITSLVPSTAPLQSLYDLIYRNVLLIFALFVGFGYLNLLLKVIRET